MEEKKVELSESYISDKITALANQHKAPIKEGLEITIEEAVAMADTHSPGKEKVCELKKILSSCLNRSTCFKENQD